MSVLFPKVNKPREWDYRPIYYDEEKEARKQKLARLRALREQKETSERVNGEQANVEKEHVTTLHRGSFREAHEAQTKLRIDTEHKSKLTFWIVLIALLLIVFYWLL